MKRINIVLCWLAVLTLARGGAAQGQESKPHRIRQSYEDIWSAKTEANGFTREKRIAATFQLSTLTRAPDKQGRRSADVTVTQLDVDVDVPAQRRKASLDGLRTAPDKAMEAHEFIRPLAFLGQTLHLTFGDDGSVAEVRGVDAVSQRADAWFDRDFRGSEVYVYARDVEMNQLTDEHQRRSWTDLIVAHHPRALGESRDLTESLEVPVIACVPSESWTCEVTLPITRTSSLHALPGGRTEIRRTGRLDDSTLTKTEIGPCPWSYRPKMVSIETRLVARPDGLVEEFESRSEVVFSSTLTLGGRDIPMQMTIRHDRKLVTLPGE